MLGRPLKQEDCLDDRGLGGREQRQRGDSISCGPPGSVRGPVRRAILFPWEPQSFRDRGREACGLAPRKQRRLGVGRGEGGEGFPGERACRGWVASWGTRGRLGCDFKQGERRRTVGEGGVDGFLDLEVRSGGRWEASGEERFVNLRREAWVRGPSQISGLHQACAQFRAETAGF